MTNDLTTKRMPWEPMPVEDTVQAMQRDLRHMLKYTAVIVHSSREELRMLVNTKRGQIMPRNECKFTDGTTVEFQDIGMPQIGATEMTVKDLIAQVWDIAASLGLELEK